MGDRDPVQAAMAAAAVVAATVPAQSMGADGASSVHWFRKGLRLHDNPALLAAVRGARCVRCVYILDPWFAASSSVGINRWRFLLQSLEDLDTSLRKLNSRLFVVRGQPADVFPRLFKEWGVTRLTFEYDSEPFGKERDAAIMKMAKEAGVEVVTENSHTLYDLDRIIEALAKWAEGKTGFPWIDAIMTQLRQEGWIHHLARHAVACFLTRGDLWVSWESGVRVFDELLLDADFSVNAGSWMWLSCSAFFQQFFHCYCPVGFGRRTDPSGDYIRRYLPKLKGFPSRYIYEPWNAPESVQKAAKCIIGVDYPRPIVNHAETSRLNIERMKQIYQQLSRYRGLCLLASVPSCVEDLSHPVAEPGSSQAGSISNTGPRALSSGPASPKRKLEAAEEPPGEELTKRARVTEMPTQEPASMALQQQQ